MNGWMIREPTFLLSQQYAFETKVRLMATLVLLNICASLEMYLLYNIQSNIPPICRCLLGSFDFYVDQPCRQSGRISINLSAISPTRTSRVSSTSGATFCGAPSAPSRRTIMPPVRRAVPRASSVWSWMMRRKMPVSFYVTSGGKENDWYAAVLLRFDG